MGSSGCRGFALAITCGLWLGALSQLLYGRADAQPRKPAVHVFLPLDIASSAVERALQEHLPDLTITVFGRFRDFEEARGLSHPDAVVAITPVLAYRGEAVTLQGKRGGASVEAYVLASADRPLDGPIDGKTIGVVDLMGREGTQDFLSHLLGSRDVKAKRVSKIEDLLPLLEFKAADGVVLAGVAVPRLVERTRLAITTRELPDALVGLPAVAVVNPAVAEVVVKSFQGLDPVTDRLLGVDAWGAP
jgi:hypothetical protein